MALLLAFVVFFLVYGDEILIEGPANLQIRLTDVSTNDQLVLAKLTAVKFKRHP